MQGTKNLFMSIYVLYECLNMNIDVMSPGTVMIIRSSNKTKYKTKLNQKGLLYRIYNFSWHKYIHSSPF